jgi:hypothetical protein
MIDVVDGAMHSNVACGSGVGTQGVGHLGDDQTFPICCKIDVDTGSVDGHLPAAAVAGDWPSECVCV